MLASALHLLAANVVTLAMAYVGLTTTSEDVLGDVRRRPAFYARALLVVFVAVPLLTIAIVKAFAVSPTNAGVVVLFSVCPAAPLVVQKLRKRDTHCGTTGFDLVVLASVLSPFVVPVWLSILNAIFDYRFAISSGALLGVVLGKVLVPLAIGVLVARLAPRVAHVLGPVIGAAATLALALVVLGLVRASVTFLLHVRFVGLFGLVLLAFVTGIVAELAAGPSREDRDALATVAMTGNPALALAVIHESYPAAANVVGIVGAFLILRIAIGLLYGFVMHRRRPGGSAHAAPGAA